MEKDTEFLVVTDENGKEIECEVILTYDSEEFGKSFVVYQIVGDESGEYYAASFNPEDGDEGKLSQVASDQEWDEIEEVLESFLEDEEEADEDEEDDEEENEEEDKE
jgi:uncharacterized protein YrzB (UPF0473 family)